MKSLLIICYKYGRIKFMNKVNNLNVNHTNISKKEFYMLTESIIEVTEQINEIKAFLYLNDNFPPWLKEICIAKLKILQTRKKILQTYNKD